MPAERALVDDRAALGGIAVIPIRRIAACERRFLAMGTATISVSPMMPKPYSWPWRPTACPAKR
jgi:hypothetical protein